MAIDTSITRAKSMIASTRRSTMSEHEKTNQNPAIPERLGRFLARKHRIEHWAYKGRSSSIGDSATIASAALGTVTAQKRSESSYTQAGRVLNMELLQLGEQRQKAIERSNFDQKLFANKQALKYNDNPNVLRTLSYVRKCCKYADTTDNVKNNIDPAIFLEENFAAKRSRSRSPSTTPSPIKRNSLANARTQTSASMAETFLRHNKRHLGSSPINKKLTSSKTTSYTPKNPNSNETPTDDDPQKRHVKFRIHTDGTHLPSQSAHVTRKSHVCSTDKQQIKRNITSAKDIPVSNSAPLTRTETPTIDPYNEEEIRETPKPRRSVSRISSAKNAVQEFRLHPERFLSAANRYLPLLRRQALEAESRQLSSKPQKSKSDSTRRQRLHFSPPISRLSDGSDLIYDDAKSFLSDENETGVSTQAPVWLEKERQHIKKFHPSKKITMMDTDDDDEEATERQLAIARLRDREFAHLRQLIRSSPIEQILEPFSAIKTDAEQNVSNERRSSTTPIIDQPIRARRLSDILHSIDSLRCSDTVDRRVRRQIDIEKNRAKLGILIF